MSQPQIKLRIKLGTKYLLSQMCSFVLVYQIKQGKNQNRKSRPGSNPRKDALKSLIRDKKYL